MNENSGWMKPKASFKLKKSGQSSKRAPLLKQVPLQPVIQNAAPAPDVNHKRRNPFTLEDGPGEKRFKASDSFSLDRAVESCDSLSQDSGVSSSHSQSSHHFSDSFSSASNKGNHIDYKDVSELPLDWSLKTKLSFTSHQAWHWGQHMSTGEAASSVTGGVRCLDIAEGNHCLDTSPNTQFHAAALYWQHPALPGLQLFPRQNKVEKCSFPTEMHRCIVSDWINSLQCVYQLVKSLQCPYFYVCSPSFTCLFRAAGIGGSQQLLALLTPTTSGIRAALKREDVEFTMPLRQRQPQDDDAQDDEEPEEVEKGQEPTEFLESLGIDSDSLLGFAATTAKTNRQTGVLLDGRSDSLVCVEGVECQSLLNYLLNAKLSQGPGGLPPTILAPVAFPGAVLKSLKVKEHVIASKPGQPKSYQMNVQGPVLPHMMSTLTRLSVKHNPSLHLHANTQEDTVAFSLFNLPEQEVAPSAFASAGLKDCGLPSDLLQAFCKKRSGSTEVAILREVSVRDGQFKVVNKDQEEEKS